MKSQRQKKLLNTAGVLFCFFITLFIYLPVIIYFPNHSIFQFFFKDLIFFTSALTLIFTAIFSPIVATFKSTLHHKLISIIFSITVLLWLQGTFLVWHYGPLDGSTINWNFYWYYGLIDSCLWIIVLVVVLIKSTLIYRLARQFAIILILGQLISISILYFSVDIDTSNLKSYYVDETSKYNFSKENNVILLVLDEFQSDIFQEIINMDESYIDIFDGFVYFRNTLAGFNFTELAIPAILTGKMYDNSIPRSSFLKHSFLNSSLPKVLKDNGFRVDLFPWLGWANESIYFNERICSNFRRLSFVHRVTNKNEIFQLLLIIDLSLFRSLPHYVKSFIYNDHEWFLSGLFKQYIFGGFVDKKFVEEALLKARYSTDKDMFKFYHFRGVHVPLRINEEFKITPMEYNRLNYTKQAKALLKICKLFFDKLKQIGVYDNSLIIVAGDHGSGRSEEMYIKVDTDKNSEFLNKKGKISNFQKDKARGIPLMLVKRAFSKGPLKINNSPVSLTDIPATIISECQIKENLSGTSIFQLQENINRKRYYGAFNYKKKRSEFVAPIKMYVVDGFCWENDSWDVFRVNRNPISLSNY